VLSFNFFNGQEVGYTPCTRATPVNVQDRGYIARQKDFRRELRKSAVSFPVLFLCCRIFLITGRYFAYVPTVFTQGRPLAGNVVRVNVKCSPGRLVSNFIITAIGTSSLFISSLLNIYIFKGEIIIANSVPRTAGRINT
jgi:hypothetical protein